MNLEEYLMGKQFSREKVEHRIASLAKYKVQIKFLKIFYTNTVQNSWFR